MKAILAISALLLAISGGLIWNWTRMPSRYGEFTNPPLVTVREVIDQPMDYLQKTVAVRGQITNQCTTMGCYFFLKADQRQLQMDLQAIAMEAPKGKDGHWVYVEGRTVPFDDGYQFWASAVEFQGRATD